MSAILIQLPPEQHAKIKATARQEGISLKDWCASALLEAVGTSEKARALTTTQMIQQIHRKFCIGDLAPQAPATEGSTAIDALVQLGWTKGKADARVKRVLSECKDLAIEQIIKEAMKTEKVTQ